MVCDDGSSILPRLYVVLDKNSLRSIVSTTFYADSSEGIFDIGVLKVWGSREYNQVRP
jgi:hypothetical protein